MDGHVNVIFFWGGEILRENNDIFYSIDPKKMQYIKLGTRYDELRNMVYELMQLSPHHWNLKLSYKYPRLGKFNLADGFRPCSRYSICNERPP